MGEAMISVVMMIVPNFFRIVTMLVFILFLIVVIVRTFFMIMSFRFFVLCYQKVEISFGVASFVNKSVLIYVRYAIENVTELLFHISTILGTCLLKKVNFIKQYLISMNKLAQ